MYNVRDAVVCCILRSMFRAYADFYVQFILFVFILYHFNGSDRALDEVCVCLLCPDNNFQMK